MLFSYPPRAVQRCDVDKSYWASYTRSYIEREALVPKIPQMKMCV